MESGGEFIDGVANAVDQCPNTVSGAKVNAVGCAIFETRIEGVNFKTSSAELTDAAKTILDDVAEALTISASVRVQVQAHIDSVGKERANQKLSDDRPKYFPASAFSDSGTRSPNLVPQKPACYHIVSHATYMCVFHHTGCDK
jgi:hypothetical protein